VSRKKKEPPHGGLIAKPPATPAVHPRPDVNHILQSLIESKTIPENGFATLPLSGGSAWSPKATVILQTRLSAEKKSGGSASESCDSLQSSPGNRTTIRRRLASPLFGIRNWPADFNSGVIFKRCNALTSYGSDS
jgi:hypothetical protein